MIAQLRKWFRSGTRGTRPSTVVRPAVPHRHGFNFAYWRTRADLIKYARELLATKEFQQLLSVLHAEMPKGYTENPALQLGRMNGWIECLRCLESLGEMPAAPTGEVPITYGAEKEFPDLSSEQPEQASE